MAIPFIGKTLTLIDRSIPEILAERCEINTFELVCFMRLLVRLGVDLFEVDDKFLKHLKKLPKDLNVAYRLKSSQDLSYLKHKSICRSILAEKHATKELMAHLKARNQEIILELNIKTESEAIQIMNPCSIQQADIVRLAMLEHTHSLNWLDSIKSSLGIQSKPIDVFPSNRLHMATSIAVDAAYNHADSLTLTFCGMGCHQQFAAFEEVLAALLLEAALMDSFSLEALPTLTRLYEDIMGVPIPDNKPIIGRSIFCVESGIHADGIQKEPSTYEPFSPNWVGLKREIILGKHSGKGSIIQKLKEMGIRINKGHAQILLDAVRQLSIDKNRTITTEFLLNLYRHYMMKERVSANAQD